MCYAFTKQTPAKYPTKCWLFHLRFSMIFVVGLLNVACDNFSTDADDDTMGADELDDDTSPSTPDSDDDDSTEDSCSADEIAAYLNDRNAFQRGAYALLCPPNDDRACYVLSPISAPCGWRYCTISSGAKPPLGKCGFCKTDADCRHPNSGYGPRSFCASDEVVPGVRFCVEETGPDWQRGDCSPYDIDAYYLVPTDTAFKVVCPSDSSESVCRSNFSASPPCGWRECSADVGDGSEQACWFCAHDGHCQAPSKCTGTYSDGTRFCEYP